MQDHTATLPAVALRPDRTTENTDAGEHFCQLFDLISARSDKRQLAVQGQPAEQKSRPAETQLRSAQAALLRAHESIAQIGLQLESERRARQYAEAKGRVQQHACEEAMELLDETVQPLRDLKAVADEYREKAEQHARTCAELEANRESIETQLRETEAALAGASERAEQLRQAVETERRVREEAEAKADLEQHAREEAARSLVNAQSSAAEQRTLAEEHARAHGEVEAKYLNLETQSIETRTSLEQTVELAEQIRLQLDTERLAREDAEHAANTERLAREDAEIKASTEQHAREEALQALVEVQNAAAEHRARLVEQELAHTVLQAQREAMEAQLKDTEAMLARTKYAAQRHADRHAQITSDLEQERRAREDAEAKLHAERAAREAAERALRERTTPSGFWSKLLRGNR